MMLAKLIEESVKFRTQQDVVQSENNSRHVCVAFEAYSQSRFKNPFKRDQPPNISQVAKRAKRLQANSC